MKLLFVLIFFNTTLINCGSQTYLFECNSKFSLKIPSDYANDVYNHEEGVFYTFYWINGDILDIHCGSMNVVDYLNNKTRYEVMSIDDNDKFELILGREKFAERFFGVLRVKGHRLTITFNCSTSNKKLFEDTLYSLKQI